MKTRRRKKRRSDKVGVGIIVLALLVAFSVQIIRLKNKNDEYAKEEAAIQKQYEEETQRKQELEELEEYMKSPKYIEDLAKSKLGLAFENEIIFKPSAD